MKTGIRRVTGNRSPPQHFSTTFLSEMFLTFSFPWIVCFVGYFIYLVVFKESSELFHTRQWKSKKLVCLEKGRSKTKKKTVISPYQTGLWPIGLLTRAAIARLGWTASRWESRLQQRSCGTWPRFVEKVSRWHERCCQAPSPRNSIVDERNSRRPAVNIAVGGIVEFQGNKKWIIYTTFCSVARRWLRRLGPMQFASKLFKMPFSSNTYVKNSVL